MYKANITPYTLALTGGLQWDSCDICGHTVHPKPEGIAYKLSPEILTEDYIKHDQSYDSNILCCSSTK